MIQGPGKKRALHRAHATTAELPRTGGKELRPKQGGTKAEATAGRDPSAALVPSGTVPVEQRAGRTTATRRVDRGALAGRSFAAIDLGSSSAKMLLQTMGTDGKLRTVVDVKIGAALGKGVQNGAPIPPENQERALDALKKFVAIAAEHGVDAKDIPMITTAVVRNAANGADFLRRIHEEPGLTRAKVLSGDEEAATGYRGALLMTGGKKGRYATLDLGGGSFQLAIGTEKKLSDGGSTQVGSNLILDTMLAPAAAADGKGDPAQFAQVDAQLAQLAPMPLDVAELKGRTLVATGGVSRFLRAHFGKDVITQAEIEALRREVIALPYADRVALVQGTKDETTRVALGIDTPEGALDYGKKLPASTTLLLHILGGIGVAEVRVSETDARHALVDARVTESQ
ncbi:MAG: hypothetical protein IT382_17545 [Deltaproteobacteria bacterium]|nr:hypothetical protein [Deltaproteobacteria bacterium]